MYKVLVIISVIGVCLSVCPDGFIQHGGSCYMELHMKATWAEANFYCQKINSELLMVDNSVEQQYITNYLTRMSPAAFDPGEFWIGGTDLFTGVGTWVWTGTKMGLSYTSWAPGSPSQSPQQRCMAMGFQSKFGWYNDVCERQKNFICEAGMN